MLKLCCQIKAKKLELAAIIHLAFIRFTAEVIPYQEQWKRVTEVES